MANKPSVVIIKGDGIGEEVIDATLDAFPEIIDDLNINIINTGILRYNKDGIFFSEFEIQLLNNATAFLIGAFTTPPLLSGNLQSIISFLRNNFNLAINLRPFISIENISKANFNIILFRQNTECLYAQKQYFRNKDEAVGEKIVTREKTKQIASAAYFYAIKNNRKKITIITKSNVLFLVDKFFKEVAEETLHNLIKKNGVRIEINHEYVDAAAYKLIKCPEIFDILLTMNMYGDILSDVLAAMLGSLGLCPSANFGQNKGLFEPIHGSAIDIAGKGIANPIGAILSASMLLEWLNMQEKANYIKSIICATLKLGNLTPDLGGTLTTHSLVSEIKKLRRKLDNTWGAA
jgi:methanogen homoisocitrate dehydrogenase